MPKYDQCREWITNSKKIGNYTWDQIEFANKKDDEGLEKFLDSKKEDDFWPDDLTPELWHEIVKAEKECNAYAKDVKYNEQSFTIADVEDNVDVAIPTSQGSCWVHYKKRLIEKSNFSKEEVDELEKSCFEILKCLRQDTSQTGPIKGLVVGNVQSGKTANMAGVMAMAADNGWNMFIILSGTIENLRQQTQKRFASDLESLSCIPVWKGLEHLSPTCTYHDRLHELSLSPNARYLTVCLKVKKRLEDLIDWLRSDPNKLKDLKIIVIDDEADQASINTGKINDKEAENNRKAINKLILDLINCQPKNTKPSLDKAKNKSLPVQAMNYISYTATPYANCLNEWNGVTLYPKHFIHILEPSKKYMGPARMFKCGDHDAKTMDIIRIIDKAETQTIKNIHKGMNASMPQGLENSILWFIISVASLRYYGRTKPVSMLIHTSQKQADHTKIAKLVMNWFNNSRATIVDKCESLYKVEIERFSKEKFREACSDYSIPDKDIPDYPPFDELVPFINELISADMRNIKMSESTKKPKFYKTIHLCIDNCNNNGITEEGDHVRLIYPDSETDPLDYAAAFIVIGGNTLARGLTLEGLVSTYFQRNVMQADTLMQMARWFGFRVKYEIFPRIWMDADTYANFEYLSDMDCDLREQLYLLKMCNSKPLDFGLTFKTSAKAKFLLTAKNKSQGAVVAEYDCSGMDTQITTYSAIDSELKQNIEIIENFLATLGEGIESTACNRNAVFWRNIDFSDIEKNIFKAGFNISKNSRTFQNMDVISEWVESETLAGHMGKWTVIVAGTKPKSEDRKWILPDGHIIGKIERSARNKMNDILHIGVLSSKKDYLADITEDMVPENTWKLIVKADSVSNRYKAFRQEAKVDDVPLLVIYRISKDSKLNDKQGQEATYGVEHDLIGLAVVTPGTRKGSGTTITARIKLDTSDDGGSGIVY